MTNNDIQNDFFLFVYAQCQFRPRAIFFYLVLPTSRIKQMTVPYNTVYYGEKSTKQTYLCIFEMKNLTFNWLWFVFFFLHFLYLYFPFVGRMQTKVFYFVFFFRFLFYFCTETSMMWIELSNWTFWNQRNKALVKKKECQTEHNEFQISHR